MGGVVQAACVHHATRHAHGTGTRGALGAHGIVIVLPDPVLTISCGTLRPPPYLPPMLCQAWHLPPVPHPSAVPAHRLVSLPATVVVVAEAHGTANRPQFNSSPPASQKRAPCATQ
eukprot:CAMPEP_0119397472 /NCGR_PEP_ID=MMETSP1334-20130426/140353_1 /TAXON_ID=127549 /ORGANISM="Calcidiscus leptoporus, Strain RCC1130" /LENGTH=115 /DNA_ID=CAMNT_0007421315 /DNA_START=177 /DNA_END=524 /DNA_ORIENTATION=+